MNKLKTLIICLLPIHIYASFESYEERQARMSHYASSNGTSQELANLCQQLRNQNQQLSSNMQQLQNQNNILQSQNIQLTQQLLVLQSKIDLLLARFNIRLEEI